MNHVVLPLERLPWRSAIVLWGMFMLISAGLGFHGVRRYEPWRTGMTDVRQYAQMVTQNVPPNPRFHRSYRVLIPYMARPVHALLRGRTGALNPVLMALLVVNAALMAGAATALAAIAVRLGMGGAAGVLAGCLLLLNVWVGNIFLVGLVDAGEVCAAVLLALALLDRRWWALPLICVGGALAKETFVVFAAVMGAVWWWAELRRSPHARRAAVWIVGSVAAGLGAVILVRGIISGGVHSPVEIANSFSRPGPGVLRRLVWTVADVDFWAGYVWLGPLGVWSIRLLPRPWLAATAAAAGVAFVMGVYAMAGASNVGRPIFSLVGPPLSLAAALTLLRQPWLPRAAAAAAEAPAG